MILWEQVVVNKDLVVGKGAVVLAVSAVDKNLEGGKTYFGTPAIEARAKWKEMAIARRLPELAEEVRKLSRGGGKLGE